MATPVVIYAAKSTEDVHGSILRQLEDCRALADRNGWEVVAEYSDEAASAYHGNRGAGLAGAKAHAQALAGEGCVLVVQHADRLARGDGVRADHLVELALWARKHGVTITSVQDPMTFEGGLAFAAMMGDRNYEDSRRKSEAVKGGKQGQLARGRAFGRLCDGYKLVPRPDGEGKDRVIDSERAPIILRLYELVEAGHTPGEVSRVLNADGLRTARNKPWRARAVRDIVTNPFYAGYAFRRDQHDKPIDMVDGDHEALIDRDRWQTIQATVKRANPRAVVPKDRQRRNHAETYILRGIASCKCGAALYVTPRNNHGRSERGYRCRDAREHTGLCHARWIPADIAERYVLEHLDSFIADIPAWLAERVNERTTEQDRLTQGLEVARIELARLQQRRDRIAEQWARFIEGDDVDRADIVLEQLQTAKARALAQEEEVAQAQARLDEWSTPAQIDEALDFYNDLVELVRGRLRNAAAAIEVRAALRSALHGAQIWLENDNHLRGIFRLEGRFHFTSGVLGDPSPPADPGTLPRWLSAPSDTVTQVEPETFETGSTWVTIPDLDIDLSGRPDTPPIFDV